MNTNKNYRYTEAQKPPAPEPKYGFSDRSMSDDPHPSLTLLEICAMTLLELEAIYEIILVRSDALCAKVNFGSFAGLEGAQNTSRLTEFVVREIQLNNFLLREIARLFFERGATSDCQRKAKHAVLRNWCQICNVKPDVAYSALCGPSEQEWSFDCIDQECSLPDHFRQSKSA